MNPYHILQHGGLKECKAVSSKSRKTSKPDDDIEFHAMHKIDSNIYMQNIDQFSLKIDLEGTIDITDHFINL